ncbi:MAG: hypothetical protein GXY77_12085 [Fibrobacter sp.]|nr:hypothetical protein [Fibrobacter sp.]
MWDYNRNETLKEIFFKTNILRKPISGIISGYHQISYTLIAPDKEDSSFTVEINGKINVSPKFIISANSLRETFGDVFDPETFDDAIVGRVFSFGLSKRLDNLKIENKYFNLTNHKDKPQEHLERINDQLMRKEDTRTGLIFCPDVRYYPVSIDRFISDIMDREF